MNIRSLVLALLLPGMLVGCSGQKDITPTDQPDSANAELELISAVDASYYPLISSANHTFYGPEGEEVDFIQSLVDMGVNTVRVRVWHDPVGNVSSLSEVSEFSRLVKSAGLKLWVTPHYSDTWADPGAQNPPVAWSGLDYVNVRDKVYEHTANITATLNPDFIQIGNEVNNGFLFPHGNIHHNKTQFMELLQIGSKAVRDTSVHARIMIHYAGLELATPFFENLTSVDYDIAGISYYPFWHGKSIQRVGETLQEIAAETNKDVIIAETAYPFTLGWNDWTHNIIGSEDQIILPEYPASPQGQLDFVSELKQEVLDVQRGLGFCYWGAEMVSWDGPESSNGSSWENQAIFDFDSRLLPVAGAFGFESS
ncbi:MAG: glycoside hydrolase family 53 protein [Candidatus Thalassarchaeaceae archaeon]